MQSHSKCGLAIVLLHCCFLSCFSRPCVYCCSHYYYFHRSFVHRWGKSSLSQFFVLCFSLFSIQYLGDMGSKKKKKFDRVLDFFFQNSIVCRVFFKNLIFQFSILCRIHFCFSSPSKRQRQRDLVFFFSLILCAYNLTTLLIFQFFSSLSYSFIFFEVLDFFFQNSIVCRVFF